MKPAFSTSNTCLALLWTSCCLAAFTELPQFSQLLLLYPGYTHYGGHYTNSDVVAMIGGNFSQPRRNTAALRLSRALNRYGGRHAIGTAPIRLSRGHNKHHNVTDSYQGSDGQQYIYRSTAIGPYLSARYGNPSVTSKSPGRDDAFVGRQGIVRMVSYRGRRVYGHTALWDCNHFHEAPNWSEIRADVTYEELWQTPDSHCPAALLEKLNAPREVTHSTRRSEIQHRWRHYRKHHKLQRR